MLKSLWRQDSTFYQALLSQHGVCVLARVPHVSHRVMHGKFGIFADERIEAHDVTVAYLFSLPHLVMECIGLVRPPYSASPLFRGLCFTSVCVFNSEWRASIPS
jgi:hypothetical protein